MMPYSGSNSRRWAPAVSFLLFFTTLVVVRSKTIYVVPADVPSASPSDCGQSFASPCSWDDGVAKASNSDTIIMRNGEYQMDTATFIFNITIIAETNQGVIVGYNESWSRQVGMSNTPFVFKNSVSTVTGILFSRVNTNAVIVTGVSSKLTFIDCWWVDSFVGDNPILNPAYIPSTIFGGLAVYSEGSLFFKRCQFFDYSATRIGKSVTGLGIAVIPTSCNSPVALIIEDSAFQAKMLLDTAGYDGGWIHFRSPNSCPKPDEERGTYLCVLRNTILSHNGAASYASLGEVIGGTLSVRGPAVNISLIDSIFEQNYAISGASFSVGFVARGGAVVVSNIPADTTAVQFGSMSNLLVKNCSFLGNQAQSGSMRQGLDINYGAPYGSASPCYGGAVGTEGLVSITVTDSLFENNTCTGGTGGIVGGDAYGAAVSVSMPFDATLRFNLPAIQFINSIFVGNQVIGGAAYRELVDRGGSRTYGGAVQLFLGIGAPAPIYIRNCTFLSNLARGGSFGSANGGAFSSLTAEGRNVIRKVHFENSLFSGNRVEGGYAQGGAMSFVGFISGREPALFDNITFEGNVALGGIAGNDMYHPANDHQNYRSFALNVAQGGAAFFSISPPAYVSSMEENAQFRHCIFLSNSAENTGEDYLESTPAPSAPKGLASGGAIHANQLGHLVISDSLIQENSAIGTPGSTALGGGIFSLGFQSRNTLFRANVAATQIVQDGNAAASVSGGAVAVSSFDCHYCMFCSNSLNGSNARGGAIYVSNFLNFQNSVVQRSFALSLSGPASGGGLHIDDEANAFPVRFNIAFSQFHQNVAESKGKTDSSFGGAIYCVIDEHCGILVSNFTRNQAHYGGAIFISTLYHQSYRMSPYFERNLAERQGSAFFINLNNNVDRRLFDPFSLRGEHPTNITFNRNEILHLCNETQSGPPLQPDVGFCGFPIEKIVVYEYAPRFIWPGMTFSTTLIFEDFLGKHVAAASAAIRVVALLPKTVPEFDLAEPTTIRLDQQNDTAEYGIGHTNAETATGDGHYVFTGLRVRLAPGVSIQLSFKSEDTHGPAAVMYPTYAPTPNRTYENPIYQHVEVAHCPPGYLLRNLSNHEYDCTRCPPGTYSIGSQTSGDECISCAGGSHSHAASRDCLVAPESFSENERWEIEHGFYPTSKEGPYLDSIYPCPNLHACRGANCSLIPILSDYNSSTDAVMWSLNCSSHHEPLCEEGYTDRLCSKCACDPEDIGNCYFSANGEEFVCRKCQAPGTAVLISAGILIIVSLVAFLLFQHSTVAIFVAEVLIAVLLLVLGLGEWWFFDVIIISALLLLISRGAAKRLSRKNQEVEHEHKQSAYFIGIVKVSLFFLQTTAAVLPSQTWPKIVSQIVETLNSFSLRISGVECLYPWIFSVPSAKFGLLMCAPIIIMLAMGLSTGIAMLLSRLSFIKKIQAFEARFSPRKSCRRCCGRRSSNKKVPREDVDAGEDNSSDVSSEPSQSDADSEPSLEPSDAESEAEEALLRPASVPSQAEARHGNNFWPRLQYSALFVLFASQFELSNVVLSNLKKCEHGFMPASPWIKCSWAGDSPQYVWLQSLSYVFLILYVLGIPALFSLLLVKNRKKILAGSVEVEHRMGFLYETYKRDVFFFEAIWLLRRILLSVAIALIPTTAGFRNAAISLILLVSLFIQQRFKPFSSGTVNTIETLSTTTLLYSFSVGSELATNMAMTWRSLLQILLWLLNCLVVLILLGALLKPVVKKLFTRCCKRRVAFKLIAADE